MLVHKEIEDILASLSAQTVALTEFRQATTPVQVALSPEMAAALGTPYRRLTPFLATVVDVISSKLEINDSELKASKIKDSKVLQAWLGDAQWSLIERELYAAAVRDGTAYILTSWEDGPKFSVREAYGVCGAHVVEEDGKPQYAFNAWSSEGTSYIDFYYPDRIEKFIKLAGDKQEWQPRTDAPDEEWPVSWVDDDGNPLGIAITEFCIGDSDIADAIQIGRDLNESLLDLLAVSRTQGWPQKWLSNQKNPGVLTNEFHQPILSASGNPIRRTVHAVPGSIMQLGENATLGQLDAATADATVLNKLLELLSFVTTVPSHYFNGGQFPSGVALIQSESRLNHKVEAHQGKLSSAIVNVLRLAMRLSNYFAGTSFDAEQAIEVPWHAPQIETEDLKRERQQFQQDSVTKLVAAGLLSKDAAVRTLHPEWTEEEISAELIKLGIAQPVEDA